MSEMLFRNIPVLGCSPYFWIHPCHAFWHFGGTFSVFNGLVPDSVIHILQKGFCNGLEGSAVIELKTSIGLVRIGSKLRKIGRWYTMSWSIRHVHWLSVFRSRSPAFEFPLLYVAHVCNCIVGVPTAVAKLTLRYVLHETRKTHCIRIDG